MNSNELRIYLRDQKEYYPGDRIIGELLLDLKKPIDVLSISLNFMGYIEFFGNRVILVNETKVFAEPQPHQKYTTLTTEQIHSFEFLFTIPRDKHLPSSVVLSKYGKVHYSLTATHKKPKLRLSHSVQPAIVEIKILDMINVFLPQYTNPYKASEDIGFVNGSKLTQWNLDIPKTAFLPGEVIEIDCNIINFPDMNKGEAIVISLIRQIQKPTSTKILEEQTLSAEYVHIYIDRGYLSTQKISIKLKIPNNAIPNILPNTGRSLSLSYIIRATLNFEGVKSAIKIRPKYEKQITVIIGTYPLAQPSTTSSSITTNSTVAAGVKKLPLMRPAEFYGLSNSSYIGTQNNSTTTIDTASISITKKSSSSSSLTDVKPLPKLDVHASVEPLKSYVSQKLFDDSLRKPARSYLPPNQNMTRKSYLKPNEDRENTPLRSYNPHEYNKSRSYLSSYSNENHTERRSPQLSPRITPNKASPIYQSSRFHSSAPAVNSPKSFSPKQVTPASAVTYQQMFDDYIPPEIAKYDSSEGNTITHIDNSMTPLPSLKELSLRENDTARQMVRDIDSYSKDQLYDVAEREIHTGHGEYTHRFNMSPNKTEDVKPQTNDSYYDHLKSKILIPINEETSNSPPGLVRHDTMSTTSSNGLSEDFNYENSSMTLRKVRYSSTQIK